MYCAIVLTTLSAYRSYPSNPDYVNLRSLGFLEDDGLGLVD